MCKADVEVYSTKCSYFIQNYCDIIIVNLC